ncbi:MAG: polysulfide reductase NrfD [Verrucomicrobia bacterium]|nr:polysulfide reductase NrfD [Verrucomicrobiota bacterium]
MSPREDQRPDFESRLDQLRQEAQTRGRVRGRGVDVAGGPIPAIPNGPPRPGYYGKPVVKPPVWVWEIALYFFIGGLAGMAAVIAAPAYFRGHADVTRAAMWLAAAGALLSPVLLIMDLGRPWLFLNMLRVFKPKSPMSVGSWIVSCFGACAIPGALAIELDQRHALAGGTLALLLHLLAVVLVVGTAFWGMFLATYTGVLIGVSAIPAWFSHHRLLPLHFGTVGLGSAAGALELLGFHLAALYALGCLAVVVETGVWLWLELRRHGAIDRTLHEGRAGLLLRPAGLLTGPIALILRALAMLFPPALILADVAFLAGGVAHRFGWIEAGHASARDPEAIFASETGRPYTHFQAG